MIPRWILLVVPFALIGTGVFLNACARATNNQQMPVQWPGGCDNYPNDGDTLHKCLDKTSHQKWLCDWISWGDSMMSLGDMFLYLGFWIKGFCMYGWAGLALADLGLFRMRRYGDLNAR